MRKMDRQQPFLNPAGLNLFPLVGNPLGNSQQLLNQLNALRMPEPNTNVEIGRRIQRMQVSNDYYSTNREPPGFNNHDEGTSRERYNRFRYTQSEEEDNFGSDGWDGSLGAIDREMPLHFLFPEMGPNRYSERQPSNELDRRNYGGSTTRRTPIRSSTELIVPEGRLWESRYGSQSAATVPWNAVLHPNCYLVPPIDDTYVLALSEKQPGCRAVFIGGLPSVADKEIIREIFSFCGPIEKITLTYLHTNVQVKHCLLQFVKHDSADRAVKLNGHVLVIGYGPDRKTKIGRIRVDYHKVSNNRDNHSDMSIANKHVHSQNEEKHLSMMYSGNQAFRLLDQIRHDQAIEECLHLLAHWLEKGECNRTTVNVFHTMLNSVNSLIKRLISRRKEHEQHVERQKQEAAERANEIKKQCEAICKVFEAATKKRSWDHFTKAQRKNITQWQNSIKDEIESAKETEIQNRVEVGMDLDDEVSRLGGLIEQPALQIMEGEQDNDQDALSPSRAKKRRMEAPESATDSPEELKSENKKLRTQVESLKAIAEQNTCLMWSMQSYQQQAETVKQQYSNLVAQKDYEIFQLKNALQGANIISDPQRAMSELEIVVEMGKDNVNVMDMNLETGKESTGNDGKHESNESEHLGESSNQLSREHNGDIQQAPGSNSEYIAMPSHSGRGMLLDEGDTEGEGGATVEMKVEEGVAKDEGTTKPEREEEPGDRKVEEGQQKDDTENQTWEEGKQEQMEQLKIEDNNNKVENEGKQVMGEDKEAAEGIAEEEGSGRFVEIDDEQFEVIDDMDEEDSGDDYKEVTSSRTDHKNGRAPAEQVTTNTNAEQPDVSVEKRTESIEETYKEVTNQSDLIENNDQLSVELSCYPHGYAAQYESWLSGAPSTGHATVAYGSSRVRITGEELVLVGIISSYLQLCPSGATSGEIRDYLSRQFKERRKDVVERLLCSLSVLFKAEDVSGNAKWKFSGFQNLAEFKGQTY